MVSILLCVLQLIAALLSVCQPVFSLVGLGLSVFALLHEADAYNKLSVLIAIATVLCDCWAIAVVGIAYSGYCLYINIKYR